MPELLAARYEVLRTVSEGPRASVFQALDHVHENLVALKCFPVRDADRAQLLAESRLLMSLPPHQALPVVRGDFFTDDGRYVLVLNWVDGTDLEQWLDDEGDPALPLDEVTEILALVATALDHLHTQDPPIVHGDVKPANIIRTAKRGIVLVDFDIAGAATGPAGVGTVGYVAPEVVAGEKPTPAADVYGLAATAVSLLDGGLPSDGPPTYPGIEPSVRAQVARVLRSALAADPARRPRTAGRLVENLRRAQRVEHASGVVALLAAEVVDPHRWWEQQPDDMRDAMGRLRSVRDEVVVGAGGWVMASMNEGDRLLAVFREASAAAEAALALHERVAAEPFPPGVDIRLRAAVAVGEASYVDGVYSGAVVDKVVHLRAAAAPGATITSESTAELLVGLVGGDISIVSLGEVEAGPLQGRRLFALTRPGSEHTVSGDRAAPEGEPSAHDAPDRGPRRVVVLEALQDPVTLAAATVCGLATIFVAVLAPVLGSGGVGALVALVSGAVAVASFVRRYSSLVTAATEAAASARAAAEAERRAQEGARSRSEARRRLELGFAQVDSDRGDEGEHVLRGLADEYEAIAELLRRQAGDAASGRTATLPGLAAETYASGISALTKALELLEFSDGPLHRRLEDQLQDVEARLASDDYEDEQARLRDEQRRSSHTRLLARHEESRRRGIDLLFEAERCTAALAATRIELASIRTGATQADVSAVVETLQDAISCVRAVEEELRSIGY